MWRDETTVGVLAYLLPCCNSKIIFTLALQSYTPGLFEGVYLLTGKPIYILLVCRFDTMWSLSSCKQKIKAATTAAWQDNLMDTIYVPVRQRVLGTKCCNVLAIVWPYVKESSVYPSLWAVNQASKQGLLRRGPPGAWPCPVTTGRDGQIIMETSWGQEIGFPFQSRIWGGFPVSHYNRPTAIDWSLACLKWGQL